jgi:histone H3
MRDVPSQLNVLGHDGDTLCVNRAEIGVLKETDQVGLSGLLESKDSTSLETQVVLEVLGNLTNETLERELADEEIRRFLVTTDLTKGNSSRAVTVGLLDSSGGRGRLASSLGGELLARSLPSGGLAGGLLGTGHVCLLLIDEMRL